MFDINNYLEKFKTLEPQNESKNENALFDTVMARVENKDHRALKTGVIHISASATMKNEIFMKKRHILEKIKNITGNASVGDIR